MWTWKGRKPEEGRLRVKPFFGEKESTGDLEGIKGKVDVEGERKKEEGEHL